MKKRFLLPLLTLSAFAILNAAENPATESAAGLWQPNGSVVTDDVKSGKVAVSSGPIRGNYPSMTLSFDPVDLSAPDAKLKLWVKTDTQAVNWHLAIRLYCADGDGWTSWHSTRRPTHQGAMDWVYIEVPVAKMAKYKNFNPASVNRIMVLGDKIVARPRPVTTFTVDGLELESNGTPVELKQSTAEDVMTETPAPGIWTPKAVIVPSELNIGKNAVSSGVMTGNYPLFTLRIPETDLSDPNIKICFYAKVNTTDDSWTFGVRCSSLGADGFRGWDTQKQSGNMAWRKFEIPMSALGPYKTTDMSKTVKIMFVGGRIYDKDKRKHRTEFFIDGLRLEKNGEVIKLFPTGKTSYYKNTPAPVKHPVLIYKVADIARARENIKRHKWAQEMYERFKSEAQFWINCPDEKLAFWIPEDGGFHVNCPKCKLNETLKPDETFTKLICTNCKEVYPSAAYPEKDVLTVTTPTGKTRRLFFYKGADQFIHRENIGPNHHILSLLNFCRLQKLHQLLSLGIVYAVDGNIKHAQVVRKALLRFAEVYPDYIPRFRATAYHYGENLMAGKLFSWKLHDSIMISKLALAYDLTAASGVYSDADRVKIENGIFREYCELMLSALPEMGDGTKNGTTTHVNAVMYTALLLGDNNLLNLAVNGPSGIKFINTYFRRDGSSRENSPAYNNMAVRPLSGMIEALNASSRRSELLNIPNMRFLFRNVARTMMPTGKTLTIGDSYVYTPYRLCDAELNYRLYPTEENRRLVNMAMVLGSTPIEDSLFFRDPEMVADSKMPMPGMVRKSLVLPGKECTILRHGGAENELPPVALTLYHNTSVAHGHIDTLNINFYQFNRELLVDHGYLGFTHPFTPFLRSPLAHNLVIADGKSQIYSRKSSLNYVSGNYPVQSVSADARNIYPGVNTARRSLVMVNHSPENSYVVDTFLIKGGKQHDYLIHADGTPVFPAAAFAPVDVSEIGSPELGTKYLYRTEKGAVNGNFTVMWHGKEVTTAIKFFPEGNNEVFRLTMPGLRKRFDPDKDVKLTAAMLRKKGPENHFMSLIHGYKKQSAVVKSERLATAKPDTAAMLVQAGNFTDIILIDNSGNRKAIELTVNGVPVVFKGKSGVISLENGTLYSLYMCGGTLLRYGDNEISGIGSVTGKVKSTDQKNFTITAELTGALPPVAAGDYLIFPAYNDGAYRLKKAAADGTFTLHNDEIIRVRSGDSFTLDATIFKYFNKGSKKKMNTTVNIRDFGAVGDGVTLDSAAVQNAFDTVSAAGGGTVIVPAGTFLVSNLQLRDNLTIHLQTGAKLLGPAESKYFDVDTTVHPKSLNRYMICGRNVKNVVIEGDGEIDGAGDNFWDEELCNGVVRRAKPDRPVVLYCIGCTDIKLRNFKIFNAASYTVWLVGCKDVTISGLTIRNDRKGPNTDALDIDCCTDVRISNCDIVAGDDCIALKSDLYRLQKSDAKCERIVVSDCIFSSSTCAIRIGYEGDGVIRDCIFKGLVCYRSAKAIAMQSLVPGAYYTEINSGTVIENIIFDDFVLRDVDRAFFWRAGNDPDKTGYTGSISNITVSNIRGNVKKESFIGGTDGYYVSGLRFDRIYLHYDGENCSPAGEYPNIWGHVRFPEAVFSLRYVKDVKINDMEISGKLAPMQWRFVENGKLNGSDMSENSK